MPLLHSSIFSFPSLPPLSLLIDLHLLSLLPSSPISPLLPPLIPPLPSHPSQPSSPTSSLLFPCRPSSPLSFLVSHLIPPLSFHSSFPLSFFILHLQSWPVVLPSHAFAVTNCVQVTGSNVAGVVISISQKLLSLQEKEEVRRQHSHSCQRGRGRRRLETPRRTTRVLQSHSRVTQRAVVCL